MSVTVRPGQRAAATVASSPLVMLKGVGPARPGGLEPVPANRVVSDGQQRVDWLNWGDHAQDLRLTLSSCSRGDVDYRLTLDW